MSQIAKNSQIFAAAFILWSQCGSFFTWITFDGFFRQRERASTFYGYTGNEWTTPSKNRLSSLPTYVHLLHFQEKNKKLWKLLNLSSYEWFILTTLYRMGDLKSLQYI
jgi:hypothetical protein